MRAWWILSARRLMQKIEELIVDCKSVEELLLKILEIFENEAEFKEIIQETIVLPKIAYLKIHKMEILTNLRIIKAF